MTERNTQGFIEACNKVARRCVKIAGGYHGSAWLFDRVMRAFDAPAVEAVTYSVYLNAPVMRPGEATIHRDGWLEMRTVGA